MRKEEYEASCLLNEALNAEGYALTKATNKLREAISTNRFPVYLSPALNGILMKEYEKQISNWREYADEEEVTSFEAQPFYELEFDDSDIPGSKDGQTFHKNGLAAVGQLDAYPAASLKSSATKLATRKNGLIVKFSWEALKNGKIDLVKRTMRELAFRAAQEESFAAASALVDAGGVNAQNFKAANANVLTGNPELSLEGLEKALDFLATVRYDGSRLVMPTKYNLVVPTALARRAEQIMAIREVRTKVGSKETITSNPITGKIAKVVEVPELGVIGGDAADKSWFLLPVKGTMPNPSVANVFLAGEKKPKIFVKRNTDMNPEDGDFLDDSYQTKIRHVVAGAMLKTIGTLASNGTGA
jgi:hypothetical protein|nr:MAG TPA: major capsid protein [Caudoviricetes sp.]